MRFIGNKIIVNKRIQYFSSILKKRQTVLLHSHFGDEGYGNLNLKKKLKIPMITSFYGYDVSRLTKKPIWRYRYGRLFSKGELFLAEGNFMKQSLINLGCQEEKIIVQHLGIDLEKIKFKPRKIGGDGKVKILIASSFREKKGIPYALEAFGKTNRIHKNLELKIIGDSGDEPKEEAEKRKVFDIIKKYNLIDSVKLLGFQPHSVFIQEVYKSHIFLSPSVHASDGDTEGGVPVSIIEASASGMPVVSTFHCDIPEVVIDGKSGNLVQERDVSSLAECMEYLITHPEKWEYMGRRGRQNIEKEYNISIQVQKLEDIYFKLL